MERHPSLDDRFDPAVRIVEHDPAWQVQAGEELRRMEEALGPVARRLEHVGSTAVPGLAAKPILDLQLSVAAIEPRAPYAGPLERLGYMFVPTGAARYEALKRALAARHPRDRLAYIEGKDEYVARIEARALQWARRGT